MMDLIWLTLIVGAGATMGLIYFSGLWLTVQAVPTSRYPALLVISSFLFRTALLVFVLCLLAGQVWQRAVAFLIGVIAVRVLVFRKLRMEGRLPREVTPS